MDNRCKEAKVRVDAIFQELEELGFDVYRPLSINDIELPSHLGYDYGVCRLVVWDCNYCDYVVKFPIDSSDIKFCEKEVDIYKDAEEEGVEEAFAWCKCIYAPEEIGNGIYVMEYVNCNEDEISDEVSESAYRRYCEDYDREVDDDDAREEFFQDYYGEDEMDDLYDMFLNGLRDWQLRNKVDTFVSEQDINDIHCGNVGYRDNQLVLCDYAGYGW